MFLQTYNVWERTYREFESLPLDAKTIVYTGNDVHAMRALLLGCTGTQTGKAIDSIQTFSKCAYLLFVYRQCVEKGYNIRDVAYGYGIRLEDILLLERILPL